MVVIEARSPDGRLIEIAEVSITEHNNIMITDDQGHQVFLSRELWLKIEHAVRTLPHARPPDVGRQ
jgi:hypothetical protein